MSGRGRWQQGGGGGHPARAVLRAGAVTLVAMALVLAPRLAQARSASALPYPTADVWAAAVRFLRVDRGYDIREKDTQAGYVLFEAKEGGKTFRGSLELVALADEEGRPSTEVVIKLPDLPQRYEMLLLAELSSKIRQERGPAPSPKPRPSPAEPAKEKEAPRPHAEPDAGLPRAPTIPVP
jgi:hypothetical protein